MPWFKRSPIAAACCVCLCILSTALAHGQDVDSAPPPDSHQLTLTHAAMCEEVEDFAPSSTAVAFSIKRGQVYCYSSFDPVPEKTFIYHSWFRREELVTTIRLTLKPPRWSTYSNIQLREADKGPWRVEIYNRQGDILKTLRFSITD